MYVCMHVCMYVCVVAVVVVVVGSSSSSECMLLMDVLIRKYSNSMLIDSMHTYCADIACSSFLILSSF